MANKLETWALPRLQQLLDLDEESLKQVITYADSLSGESAAEHLKNLLGDGAKSLDFISGFNLVRRQQQQQQQQQQIPLPPSSAPASASTSTSASSNRPHAKGKKKANIHALPPRQVEGHGNTTGAYQKRSEEDDYLARPARQRHKDQVADNLALRQSRPDATQLPLITDSAKPTTLPITAKPPPSASGPLISDSLSSRKNATTTTKGAMASSRTASPAAKTKINISGGTAMHGASTALTDLDSAIRSLEVQTNPSLTPSAEDDLRRKCNCMATRHPLLDMAPNCLNCGKIICVKEGLAPCTFCKSPLLDQEDVLRVLRVLKDERKSKSCAYIHLILAVLTYTFF